VLQLSFVTRVGSAGNLNYDWALWRDVRIVIGGEGMAEGSRRPRSLLGPQIRPRLGPQTRPQVSLQRKIGPQIRPQLQLQLQPQPRLQPQLQPRLQPQLRPLPDHRAKPWCGLGSLARRTDLNRRGIAAFRSSIELLAIREHALYELRLIDFVTFIRL
jgi:hypothetical protein